MKFWLKQRRLKATSVINCEPVKDAIAEAIARLFSTEFEANLQTAVNPYGGGGASDCMI